jgi:hypothetical protein
VNLTDNNNKVLSVLDNHQSILLQQSNLLFEAIAQINPNISILFSTSLKDLPNISLFKTTFNEVKSMIVLLQNQFKISLN